jgi:hypothetical protein
MLQVAVLKKSAEETTEGANVSGAEMLRLELIAVIGKSFGLFRWPVARFLRGHVVFRDERIAMGGRENPGRGPGRKRSDLGGWR